MWCLFHIYEIYVHIDVRYVYVKYKWNTYVKCWTSSLNLGRLRTNNLQCQNRLQKWSPVRRILRAWEKNSKKTRILWPHFLQMTELLLECVFVSFPGVVDRSEFVWDCSLHLAFIGIYSYACMEKHVFATCNLSVTCGLPLTRALSLWLCASLPWLLLTHWV